MDDDDDGVMIFSSVNVQWQTCMQWLLACLLGSVAFALPSVSETQTQKQK